MQIRDVIIFRVRGTYRGPYFPSGDRQAQALDIYPEFNTAGWAHTRSEGSQAISEIYLEVLSDDGVSGLFGPIDEGQAFIVHKFLRPFLLGRDPLAIELLHDQMLRLHRHGRSGIFVTGVSAVDCALWDLKGKAWNQPVYRLLGGPTRPSVPAYASMLGYSVAPEAASEVALNFKEQGYPAQKWFFRYGPADGDEGKARNAALASALRETLGPYYPLMFDAFWGWDVRYAQEMLQLLKLLNITWLEEPLPAERIGGLRRLKAAAPDVPLAAGEHVYTRWQVKELLVNAAVDIVQTDPDWTGGVTEMLKIAALCSAFETPLIPHGHSLLAALHIAGAQSPTTIPYVEYLVRHQVRKQFFQTPFYEPIGGTLALPELPGLGLALDEEKIEARETL